MLSLSYLRRYLCLYLCFLKCNVVLQRARLLQAEVNENLEYEARLQQREKVRCCLTDIQQSMCSLISTAALQLYENSNSLAYSISGSCYTIWPAVL